MINEKWAIIMRMLEPEFSKFGTKTIESSSWGYLKSYGAFRKR